MKRRSVKVFSMSFLDLLCCGLGAVILLNLLMIVSIRREAAGAIEYTYFIADIDVWIRVSSDKQEEKGQPAFQNGLEARPGSKVNLLLPLMDEQKVLSLAAGDDPFLREMDSIHNPGGSLYQLVKELPDLGLDPAFMDDAYPVKLEVSYRPSTSSDNVKRFEFGSSGNQILGASEINFYRDEASIRSFYWWKGHWYYRITMHAWGLHTPLGLYSFEVSGENRRKGGGVGIASRGTKTGIVLEDHYCRVELQGSGLGGHQILQTHPDSKMPVSREVHLTDLQKSQIASLSPALKQQPDDEEKLMEWMRIRSPLVIPNPDTGEAQFRLVASASPKFAISVDRTGNTTEFLSETNVIFESSKLADRSPVLFLPTLYVTSGRN